MSVMLYNMSTETLKKHPTLPKESSKGADSFGGHSRIAHAIKKFIETHNQGLTIGLLGEWGSGKSFTINLLKEELKENEQILFFTFDTWIHQSDPIRRAFLEQMMVFLDGEKRLTNPIWKERKEELFGNVERILTIKDSMPGVTRKTYYFIKFVCISVIGYILTHYTYLLTLHIESKFLFYLIFTLACIPIIILPLIYIASRPWPMLFGLSKTNFFNKKNWKGFFVTHQKNLLSSVFDKIIKTKETATFKESEPTASEFHGFFSELIEETLESDEKLVVIIDNIDRLHHDEAFKIFSTIRGFFQKKTDADNHQHTNKVYTLFPVDKKGLELVLNLGQKPNEDGLSQNNTDIVSGLIDKTFDITFHVPPPLLSNWKDFLSSTIKTSLKDSIYKKEIPSNYDLERVCSLYEIHNTERLITPTPRKIKVLVTDAISLKYVWDNISLASIFAFLILCKDEHKDPINFIGRLQALSRYQDTRITKILKELSLNWDTEFSQIYFGTDENTAIEAYISPIIESALTQNDFKKASEHIELKGFDNIISSIAEKKIKQLSSGNEPLYFNAISCLLKLEEERGYEFTVDTVWESILEPYRFARHLRELPENLASIFISLTKKLKNKKKKIAFIKENYQFINHIDKDFFKEKGSLDLIYDVLSRYTYFLYKTEIFNDIKQYIEMPKNDVQYYYMLKKAANNNNIALQSIIVPIGDKTGFWNYFVAQFASDPESFFNAVRYLAESINGPKYPWDVFLEGVRTRGGIQKTTSNSIEFKKILEVLSDPKFKSHTIAQRMLKLMNR